MESPCHFLFRKLEDLKETENYIDNIFKLKEEVLMIEQEFVKYIYLLALRDFENSEEIPHDRAEQFFIENFTNKIDK